MTSEVVVAVAFGSAGVAINLIGLGAIYGQVMGRLELLSYRMLQVERVLRMRSKPRHDDEAGK